MTIPVGSIIWVDRRRMKFPNCVGVVIESTDKTLIICWSTNGEKSNSISAWKKNDVVEYIKSTSQKDAIWTLL